MYIAAYRHRDAFLTRVRADPRALPASALPMALRLGGSRPDWRTPLPESLAADWKEMKVPGKWESLDLPAFDGVVWFTRTVTWPAGASAGRLSLGRIGNVAEIWINGQAIAAPNSPTTGRQSPAIYPLPAGTLKAGTNAITVRIQNTRGDGGFLGAA